MSNWFDSTRQDMRSTVERGDGLTLGLYILAGVAIVIVAIVVAEYFFCSVHGVLSM